MTRPWPAAIMLLLLAACQRDRPPPGGAREALPVAPELARADSLYLAGQFEQARELWERAIDEAAAGGDSATIARLLTSIGLAQRNLGRYPQSRATGERALELKLRLGLERDLFRSYNALGLLAWDQNLLDDALSRFEQAEAAARAVGDSVSIAKAAHNKALVDLDRGEPLLARDGFVLLRDVSRRVDDPVSLGRALLNLAMLDLQFGDPINAVASIEEARQVARAAGDAEAEENALGQMATAYQALGEPQRAFAAMDSALALAESLGMRRRVAENLELLGGYYGEAGDHRRALGQYAGAQLLNVELGLLLERGNTLRREAISYRALGRPDTAAARLDQAIALHRSGGFRRAELADLLLLAEIAADRGNRATADAALHLAATVALVIGTDLARADVLLAAARIHDRFERPAATLAALDSAGSTLALLGAGNRWEPDALRARAHARLGRPEAAELAGRRAIAAIEQIRAAYGSGVLRTAYLSQRAGVYADLVVVLLARNQIADAFEVADAARGRALLEHLGAARRALERGQGTAAGLLRGQQLLQRIDSLTAQLRSAADVRPDERAPADEHRAREIERRLAAAREEYETLLARIARTAPEGAALLGAAGSTLEAIRRQLRPGELLVEYLVAEDRLHLFAVDREGISHTEQALPIQQLESRVRLAVELTGRRGTGNKSDRVLAELHRLLVEPLDRMVPMKGVSRLLLVPHGPLAYLPFAALLDGEGAPLVSRFSLLMLPAASSLPALRSRPGATGAGPARHVALAPLPEDLPASREEASDVSRALRGLALVGPRATEAVLRRELERARIVHVASHAVLNPFNPMFSRVDLARGRTGASEHDGRLEVHELLGLRVAASLIFLSGCETGRGPAWRTSFDRGEDYVTLGQAFLYAGATNVVATLWRVNDPGAATLARLFYEAGGAEDAVEALARAQRTMFRDPAYREPYYWAAYQVSGAGLPGPAG